jgi:cobalt/nickel transport system permease protein
MHLSDHYLDPATCAATGLLAAGAVGLAVSKLRTENSRDRLSIIASVSAAVFAAQMVNYPVGQGTSGHLIGGALTGLLLGPWTAMVVMTIVITVQALLFADGGLAALGANVLNMAVVAPLAAIAVDRVLRRSSLFREREVLRSGLAAWACVMAAAATCSLEIAASGQQPLIAVLPTMTGIHAVIGLSEALITAAVLLAVRSTVGATSRAPMLPANRDASCRRLFVPLLLAAIIMAALVSPFASGLPDGLESAASQLALVDVPNHANWVLMPDYEAPGIAGPLSTSLAGLIGVVVAFGLTLTLARVSTRLRPNMSGQSA